MVKTYLFIASAVAMLFCGPVRADESDLVWSTFLGGSGSDRGYDITVDRKGNVYLTGHTSSSDFPTTPGAFDTTYNSEEDVFVAKLDPTGMTLVYATLLGGSGDDVGQDIAIDSCGNVHVTGHTNSSNFPCTAGAFDSTPNGGEDVFVIKLSPEGTVLIYSTLLGGDSTDVGLGLDVDTSGKAYVTGYTKSRSFPTTSKTLDTLGATGEDVFAAKLNTAGSELEYSTCLGGSRPDNGRDIVVDHSGCAYLTGITWSEDFPFTSGAFDTTHNGKEDAFVVKLDPAGNTLLYGTFLGGTSFDKGMGVAVDDAGHACVTGYTRSPDFPITHGVVDSTYGGSWDIFVVKLEPRGDALSYATYLGGTSYEKGFAVTLDQAGCVYVTGYTWSEDFPTTRGAFDPKHNGAEDIYVAKLNIDGTALLYATYLGGSAYDESQGICVDESGDIYITGTTHSVDFPTTASMYGIQRSGGASNAIVVKMRPDEVR